MKKYLFVLIFSLVGFTILVNAQNAPPFSIITDAEGATLDSVWLANIVFADINGDNSEDVFVSGSLGSASGGNEIAKLYVNDGNGAFSEKTGFNISGFSGGSAVFGDVDGDSDLDLIVSGNRQDTVSIYKNDGVGNFTRFDSELFTGYNSALSQLALADIDNDQDQDLIITYVNSNSDSTSLFKNNGNGTFTPVNSSIFSSLARLVLVKDLDGDGDQDVILASFRKSAIYENNGLGVYTEVTTTQIPALSQGSIDVADVDGDNDLDLLVSGMASIGPIAELYINNGNLNFTQKPNTPFGGFFQCSVVFSDLDLDGDQDFVIGGDGLTGASTKIFVNDGLGNFTEDMVNSLTPGISATIGVSDFDGDNDFDILVTNGVGGFGGTTGMTRMYRNDLCSADRTTDVVNTCGSYTWIDGVTYTANNNTAIFSLTNARGCDSTVTLNLTTLVIDTLVVNTSDSLYANAPNLSYQWINCDSNKQIVAGATQQGFKPDTTGNFAVIVTDGNCSDTSSCQYVDLTYLNEHQKMEDRYKIYPVPAKDIITINQSANKSFLNRTAFIYALDGKLMLEKNISKKITSIDIANLEAGIYFLEIDKLKQKIVISR